MKDICVIDVESTGLLKRKSGGGDIHEFIQFSAIIMSGENMSVKSVIDFYCQPDIAISAGAMSAHEITDYQIRVLSKGRTIQDNMHLLDWLRGLENTVIVAHNSSFDKSMINQTLEKKGLPLIDFGEEVTSLNDLEGQLTNFCSLKGIKKSKENYPERFVSRDNKLTSLIKDLGTNTSHIRSMFTDFLKNIGKESHSLSAHNSLYDVFVLCLVLRKYRDIL